MKFSHFSSEIAHKIFKIFKPKLGKVTSELGQLTEASLSSSKLYERILWCVSAASTDLPSRL